MKYEKSCGAVVYQVESGEPQFLIERMKRGHYSLPKGHVEKGENEAETATREILEETGLTVNLDTSFRKVITYSPDDQITKDVVFFTALVTGGVLKNQEEEVSDILFLPYQEAFNRLTFDSDKAVLKEAHEHITQQSLPSEGK